MSFYQSLNVEKSLKEKKDEKYQWLFNGSSMMVALELKWFRITNIGNKKDPFNYCCSGHVEIEYYGNYQHIDEKIMEIQLKCGDIIKSIKNIKVGKMYEIDYLFDDYVLEKQHYMIDTEISMMNHQVKTENPSSISTKSSLNHIKN